MWIVRLALRRPYTFVVASLLLLLLTPFVLLRTPTDIFPAINIPVVSVIWQYTGLPADQVEQRMVYPNERALTTTVNNIEHIQSTSYEGVGVVKTFFQPGASTPQAVAEVTAECQTILKQLPQGTTPPLVIQYNASTVPILQYGVSSSTLSEQQIYDLSLNTIRVGLVSVPGVGIPLPYGGKVRVISVDLSPRALEAQNLSEQDVVNALSVQNLVYPSGTAKIGANEYPIDLNTSPRLINRLNELPIKSVDGAVIRIRDVAEVHDGYMPQQNMVWQDGVRSTLLSVLKNGSASTLQVAAGVKAAMTQVMKMVTGNVQMKQFGDQSIFVEAAVTGVVREGLIAACLTAAKNSTNIWKVAEPAAQLPKGDWWKVFEDGELNELENEALAANQQLKVSVARLSEAQAQMNVARAGLFPNISASGSFARQRTSPNAPSTAAGQAFERSYTFDDFYVPLIVGYEVDLWGRVRRSVESARAQFQASADDLESVKLILEAEVAVDYFSLRTLDAQKVVLTADIEVFTKSLQLTRNLRAGGAVSDLDVAQSQTVLGTTEAQLPAVVLQRAQFEHAIALLVGQPASSFRISEHPLSTAPPFIPAEAPSQLLERRPDLAAAERQMASANASIGVAKAAFFPTIQLNGLAGLESISAGTLFNGASRLWAVGPSITAPIFEGGRLRAGLQFAEATYDETVATYCQTVLSAFSEVEDSLAAQTLVANQYAAESDALIAARKQLEIVNNQYLDGLITYLDVATAESTELNVEFTATQLRGEQLIAVVTLVKALGGGWQSNPERAKTY